MTLKAELYLSFGPFASPNDRRLCIHLPEHRFVDAYSVLDTPSRGSLASMTLFERQFFMTPEHVRSRVMTARNAMARSITEDFREYILETLAQHDTIDGYKKS